MDEHGTPWFATCSVCREGVLLAVTVNATDQLRLVCDECESQWLTLDDANSFEKALPEEVPPVSLAEDSIWSAAGWHPMGRLGRKLNR